MASQDPAPASPLPAAGTPSATHDDAATRPQPRRAAPSTGDDAAPLTVDTPAEAVARTEAAAKARSAHSRRARVDQLKGLRRMLEVEAKTLQEALAEDLGKSAEEAQITELYPVKEEVSHALLHLTDWMEPRSAKVPLAFQPASAKVRPTPKGRVLIIGAWNYPLQLALAPLVGAIAAGNTVVLSPSEKAPATARALQRLIPQYLDRDLVAVVEGGADCVTELLTHPWGHVLYTGGERVGRIVYEAAAKTLTPVTLELGGKSPAVVTDSRNDMAIARRLTFAKFTNAGQTCVAPDYVLAVGDDIARELEEKLPEAIREFYGQDPAASGDYGRLVDEKHARRLETMLEEAVAAGARIVTGGAVDVEGRYMEPTVVADVAPDSPLMREEIFGPILPILKVGAFQAAIDHITAGPIPLAAYLFTDSPRFSRMFEEQVQAGAISTDVALLHAGMVTLPFGGVGSSGIGRYHGQYGFEEFSHLRSELTKSDQIDTLKAVYPPRGWAKRQALRTML